MTKGRWIVLALLGLAVAGFLGSRVNRQPAPIVIVAPSSTPGALHPTMTPRATPSRTAQPALTEDGTYLVGADIAPGQYRAPDAPSDCLWELKSKDGTVIDLGIGARPIIRIGKNADTFTSSGCGTWEKVK